MRRVIDSGVMRLGGLYGPQDIRLTAGLETVFVYRPMPCHPQEVLGAPWSHLAQPAGF